MTLTNIRLIPEMNPEPNLPTVHGRVPSVVYQLAPSALCFMAKEIPLTNSSTPALVDDCDFDLVSVHKWYRDSKGYAVTTKKPKMKMHRLIMGPDDPKVLVDHIDGVRLNNQRENLRLCTHKENTRYQQNKMRGKSKYKGVSLLGLTILLP